MPLSTLLENIEKMKQGNSTIQTGGTFSNGTGNSRALDSAFSTVANKTNQYNSTMGRDTPSFQSTRRDDDEEIQMYKKYGSTSDWTSNIWKIGSTYNQKQDRSKLINDKNSELHQFIQRKADKSGRSFRDEAMDFARNADNYMGGIRGAEKADADAGKILAENPDLAQIYQQNPEVDWSEKLAETKDRIRQLSKNLYYDEKGNYNPRMGMEVNSRISELKKQQDQLEKLAKAQEAHMYSANFQNTLADPNSTLKDINNASEMMDSYDDSFVMNRIHALKGNITGMVANVASVYDVAKDYLGEKAYDVLTKNADNMLKKGYMSQEDYDQVADTYKNLKDFDAQDPMNFSTRARELRDMYNTYSQIGAGDVSKTIGSMIDSTGNFLMQYWLATGLVGAVSATPGTLNAYQQILEKGGNLATAFMGTQSFSDKYLQLVADGVDQDTAMLNGLLTGLTSYLVEKIGTDRYVNMVTGHNEQIALSRALEAIRNRTIPRFSLGGAIESAVGEGSEEVIENLVDGMIDHFTTGEPIDYDAGDLAYAWLVGAGSGFLMGGQASLSFALNTKKQYNAMMNEVNNFRRMAETEDDPMKKEGFEAVARAGEEALRSFEERSAISNAVETEEDIVPDTTDQEAEDTLGKAVAPDIMKTIGAMDESDARKQKLADSYSRMLDITKYFLGQDGTAYDAGKYLEADNKTRQDIRQASREIYDNNIKMPFDPTLANDIYRTLDSETKEQWRNISKTMNGQRKMDAVFEALERGQNGKNVDGAMLVNIDQTTSLSLKKLMAITSQEFYGDKKNNIKGIDLKSDAIFERAGANASYITTAVHEMIHSLEGTKAYQSLKKMIINEMGETNYKEALKRISKLYEVRTNNFNAENELIAFYCQENFGNSEFLQKMNSMNKNAFTRITSNLMTMMTGDSKAQMEQYIANAVNEFGREGYKGGFGKGTQYNIGTLETRTKQFEIIQRTNPMTDDSHTGIRSVDDIRTFDEVNSNPQTVAPDFTKTDVEIAKETGFITVYSSKPIRNGVFVTPSRMEAENYAGDGNVYSKQVSVHDVAWIDAIEGQYAKTSSSEDFVVMDEGETAVIEKNMAQFNLGQYYDGGGREYLKSYLEQNQDISDKEGILERIDEMAKVMKEFEDTGKFPSFSKWQDQHYEINEKGELSVVINNGDYELNIDFSTVCKKRKMMDKVLNQLAKNGYLDFDGVKSSLDPKQMAKIRKIIQDHGLEVACGMCFVDTKRYNQGKWAGRFESKWNGLVDQLAGYLDIDEESVEQLDFVNGKTKASGQMADIDFSDPKLKSFVELSKGKSEEAQMAKALIDNPGLRAYVSTNDLFASEGFGAIRDSNPELYKLVNASGGSSKPKLAHGEINYRNEVLTNNKFTEESARMVGGVRLQSFSDFMANMVFDYVQMFGDLEAKNLPAHSYTKVKEYALLFGKTGMKINLSLIPASFDSNVYTSEEIAKLEKTDKKLFGQLKANAGLDADGNYLWDPESFDYQLAMEIQDLDGYDKNVGSICVGVSDAHIRKLLEDPKICMVIPYHRSGISPIVQRSMGLQLFNDYTNKQNTRFRKEDGKPGKKIGKKFDFDFYGGSDVDGKHFPGMIELGYDAKKASQSYLDWCEANNYVPKFDAFAYNEDGSMYENYYKLLIDFRAYDKSGNVAPQEAVNISNPESFGTTVDMIDPSLTPRLAELYGDDLSFKNVLSNGLELSELAEAEQNEQLNPITQEVIDALGLKSSNVNQNGEYSFGSKTAKEIDAKYSKAVEDGDMATARRLVDEKAIKEGYTIHGYHGTSERFNVFDKSYRRYDATSAGFIYISTDEDYAEIYSDMADYDEDGGVVMSLFAKPGRVLDIGEVNEPLLDSDGNYSSTAERLASAVGMETSEFIREMRKNHGWDMDNEDAWVIVNTPEFSDLVKSAGYDSIKLSEGGEIAYGVIDPNQVKSADTVVYDDDGSIIPLSERFNSDRNDVRYSFGAKEHYQSTKEAFDNSLSEEERQAVTLNDDKWSEKISLAQDIANRIQDIVSRVGKDNFDEAEFNKHPDLAEDMERLDKMISELGDSLSDGTYELPERTALQNKILSEYYDRITNGKTKGRVASIIIGPPASGKSSVIAKQLLKTLNAVELDSDAIKELLPEFKALGGLVANYTHRESALMAEKLRGRLFDNGYNVVLPLVGKNDVSISELIDSLKEKGYNDIGLYYVGLEQNKFFGRAITRFTETGRLLKPSYLRGIYANENRNPKSTYEKLKNKEGVTYHAEYYNGVKFGEPAELRDFGGVSQLNRPGNTQGAGESAEGQQASRLDGGSLRVRRSDDGKIDQGASQGAFFDALNNGDISLGETQTAEQEQAQEKPKRHRVTGEQMYQNAQKKYGIIPPGMDPKKRESDVPRQTSDKTKTSKFARTLYESKSTSNSMAKSLRGWIGKGMFDYAPQSTEEMLRNALDTITVNGEIDFDIVEDVAEQLLTIPYGTMSADTVALAQIVLMQLDQHGGRKKTYARLASKVREEGTAHGRFINALKMMKQISPDGRVYVMEEHVNKIAKQLADRTGKDVKVEIPENLKEELRDAKTEKEVQKAHNKIADVVAKQLPSTFMDKMNAWRYLAMLGNPRTHIRNILGNVGMAMMKNTKDALATVGELTVKNKTKAIVSRVSSRDKAYRNLAKTAYVETYKDMIEHGGSKYDIKDMIKEDKKVFKDKGLGKVANWMIDKNSNWLSAEDNWFLSYHFENSFAGYLKANKIDPKNFDPRSEVGIKAGQYAMKEAMKATFHDQSKLANAINNLAKSNKGAGIIIDAVAPFKQTPINIAKRMYEYSPLGLISAVKKLAVDVRKGKATGSDVIDSLSASLTGSGIALLGALLYSMGILHTKDDDKDRKQYFDEDLGEQDYAIVTDKGTYTIDWSTPAIAPLAMGAQVLRWWQNRDDIRAEDVVDATIDTITNAMDPLFETSMLQGVTKALTSYGDDAGGKIGNFLWTVGTNYASQYVWTLSGQIARTLDKYRRTTYPNTGSGDSFVRALRNKRPDWRNLPILGDRIEDLQNIPVVGKGIEWLADNTTSTANEPYINRKGEKVEQEDLGLGMFGRFMLNTLSPGYYKSNTADKYDEELLRLYESTGEDGTIPTSGTKTFTKDKKKTDLKNEDYTKFNEYKWRRETQMVNEFIKSAEYKMMNDEQRADVIEKLRKYAGDEAKDWFAGGEVSRKDYHDAMQASRKSSSDDSLPTFFDFYVATNMNEKSQKTFESAMEMDGIYYNSDTGKFSDTKQEGYKKVSNSEAFETRKALMDSGQYKQLIEYIKRNGLDYSEFGLTKTVVNYSDSQFNQKYNALMKKIGR